MLFPMPSATQEVGFALRWMQMKKITWYSLRMMGREFRRRIGQESSIHLFDYGRTLILTKVVLGSDFQLLAVLWNGMVAAPMWQNPSGAGLGLYCVGRRPLSWTSVDRSHYTGLSQSF